MTDVAKPMKFDPRAGALAGLIAGLVFLIVELGLVWATTGSPWGPVRMIAAIGLGEGVLPAPGGPPTFDATALVVAMLIHLALSAVLGVVWALVFGRLGGPVALIIGAVFGLVVYGIHFFGMTELFPWFAMARNWVSILAHAVFGLSLAWAYGQMRSRVV